MKTKYHNSKNNLLAGLIALSFFSLVVPQVTASNSNQVPEQAVFGIEPVLSHPDPESRQYITKTVSTNESPQYFNAEPDKQTQSVVISGHVLIFEEGHDNGLWESYHDYKTLQDLELHADTIIIRGALKLPQTNVTMYARELRFEDTNGTASVNTTPYSLDIPALPQKAGLAGNPGGDITLHLDIISLANPASERFILSGGLGQEGGIGKAGANASNTKIWTGRAKRTSGLVEKHYDFVASDRALYVFWPKEGFGIQKDKSWGDRKARPKNGGAATAPGFSGNGGRSGNLTAPLLTSWFDISHRTNR